MSKVSPPEDINQNALETERDADMFRSGFGNSESMDLQTVSIGICAMNKKVCLVIVLNV